jgi:hypothetical protein
LPVILRKTVYISIFLLSITKICFGQDYIDYFKLINKAEIKIVESDFESSLNHYQKAFELIDKPFAKDLYNASLCSAKSNNDSVTYLLVKQQVQKGIPLKIFRSKYYKHFKKSNFWELLKREEKTLIRLAKVNVNQDYLNKLKELEKLDQKIRKRKYGYPMSDTIRKVDSLNMIKLVSLIDKFGYPSENVIGINNPKKTWKKPQNIVLRHYFQSIANGIVNEDVLGNRLSSALKNGDICPVQYSVWEDFRYKAVNKRHKYGIYAVILENGKFRKNELNNINEINKYRIEIGIGTYDEYVSKIIFQENQNEFYFGINEGIIMGFEK